MPTTRSLVVASALALSSALLLAGCASGASSTPAASVAAATDISSCDAAKTTISAVFGQQGTPAMEVATAALIKKYPGLTINATAQTTTSYDDLTKTVVGDIAVGKRPDVVMTGLGQLRFWVDAYKPHPIDTTQLPSTYQTQFLTAGTVDGKVYLAPSQISAPVLVVNEKLLDAAGVDSSKLKTFSQLEAAAEKVTAETKAPSVSISTDALPDWFTQAFVQGAGDTFVKSDGSAGFGTAAGIEDLGIWQALAEKKLELGVGFQDGTAAFIGGKAAFMVTTTSVIASLQKGIGSNFTWSAVDLPSATGKDGALPAGGNGWIVLSQNKCSAAFSNALVSELLSTEAVLKQSGANFSYIPVDSAAAKELLGGTDLSQPITYAWSYDKKLTPWGGFAGAKTVQINDQIRTMTQRLQSGGDTASTVKTAVSTINAIVK